MGLSVFCWDSVPFEFGNVTQLKMPDKHLVGFQSASSIGGVLKATEPAKYHRTNILLNNTLVFSLQLCWALLMLLLLLLLAGRVEVIRRPEPVEFLDRPPCKYSCP